MHDSGLTLTILNSLIGYGLGLPIPLPPDHIHDVLEPTPKFNAVQPGDD